MTHDDTQDLSQAYVEDAEPGLAHRLLALRLGPRVPPALYVAIAEVLAWLFREERRNRTRP